MISRNLYFQIVIRVLLIVAASLCLGWLLFFLNQYILAILNVIILIFLTINLILFLNRTNRQLSYFFDSIQNEDSSLSFPKNSNKILDDLNKNLIKVNQLIHQIQVENRQQEQYFQALLEHVATGIITFDKKGFVLHSNSSVRNLFSLEVLTHLNQLDKVDRKLCNAIKNIQPPEQKLVQISNESQNIQVVIKANSFKTDNKELVLVSVQDIKNELDEKELESWRKLIRVLMHEIMNSITPITSLSESLHSIYISDGKRKSPEEINSKVIETTIKGLDVIKEQGKGLIAFVESYRKLTRLPQPKKKAFGAKSFIEKIRLLSESFELGIDITIQVETKPADLEILGDEKMLSQVLINLVKNAYQANLENADPKIKISAYLSEAGRPEIKVSDNGPGIPEEILDKIFVPFFTTKEKGSGIGLSLSRQIMLLHGGNLKIVTAPGKITSAILTF